MLRVARAAAVAQQVDVELELGAGGGEIDHRIVQFLEGSLRAQQMQARPDA